MLLLFMLKELLTEFIFGIRVHSFLQGWNLPFSEGTPLSGYPPLSDANLKSYPPPPPSPPPAESHPNWCMQIVRNTLK